MLLQEGKGIYEASGARSRRRAQRRSPGRGGSSAGRAVRLWKQAQPNHEDQLHPTGSLRSAKMLSSATKVETLGLRATTAGSGGNGGQDNLRKQLTLAGFESAET